jgi:molecular chaperone HtpG
MMDNEQNYEFGVETKKILKLMIHSLYTNKDIVVRELISNSSDACDKLRYMANMDANILTPGEELGMEVEIDETARTLAIRDNGIGMDQEDLRHQLGVIAKSGTEAFLEQISKGSQQNAIDLIGQFGVGFYSSFMLASRVEVISRKVHQAEAYRWQSAGEGEFSIGKFTEFFARGTKVILYLKEGEDVFLDRFHLKHVIKSYSDHIAFPIRLQMGSTNTSIEVINTGTALWIKPKADISREQYQEFYKYIIHMPGEPWMILHNKVEGNLEFTNLLFIPDRKTFDLFNPEMNTRVKLYIKRVFITEESVQLLPRYLRFVQGVVDSQDLPLNISRETLQYNNTVEKIKKALVKKIFAELGKKDENEPDEYLKFWDNFGAVLKEGLCEHNTNNDDLLDICKFYTSKSTDKPISLKTYAERMNPDQQGIIYYITGNSVTNIDSSPQVEGFKAKGIEVLYLYDTVDDFWVTATHKYRDYEFKSITRADVDVDDLSGKKKSTASADEVVFDALPKNTRTDKEDDYQQLLQLFRTTLENCHLKDIRISKKLTKSPVCLVADEKSMDIKLERFLLEQKQILAPLPKILEINPQHELIRFIQDNISNGDQAFRMSDIIKMLFDEACILEGEPVCNPAEFASRLNKFMEK